MHACAHLAISNVHVSIDYDSLYTHIQSSSKFQYTRGIPEGCQQSQCDYFVGINPSTNKNLIDITLEGRSEGWVAVGFSKTPNMVYIEL